MLAAPMTSDIQHTYCQHSTKGQDLWIASISFILYKIDILAHRNVEMNQRYKNSSSLFILITTC